jgi:HEAT repeat protein
MRVLGLALSHRDASWKAVWVAQNAANEGMDMALACEGLAACLKSGNVFIRRGAAQAILTAAEKGKLAAKAVRPALEAARSDGDPDTRLFAMLAIKKLPAEQV